MTQKLSIVVIILLIVYFIIPTSNTDRKSEIIDSEVRGVFISYLELNTYIRNRSYDESVNNIKNMVKELNNNKFNTVYLQVRSHMDSIYESNIFPPSKSIILNDGSHFDVLKLFIEEASKYNIKIYAWVNPYRIGETFDENSKYYIKVKDSIKKYNNMYYLDPSSSDSTSLIVEGISEIVKKYKVRGVIFDDYFYPNKEIDLDNYEKSDKKYTIEEYRLNNINNMVYSVNKKIKEINKDILFGISPDGNIDNDYNSVFADVKKWGSNHEYVDFLMPQLYYGFENEVRPFESTLDEWKNLVTDKNIELIVALAFYKSGEEDMFAKSGKYEWINNNDIIKRQVINIRESNRCNGFSLFRYDSLFSNNKTESRINEFNNLREIM